MPSCRQRTDLSRRLPYRVRRVQKKKTLEVELAPRAMRPKLGAFVSRYAIIYRCLYKNMKYINFLKGYRTYLLAFLGIVVAGAQTLGYIDLALANSLLGILGFGAIATLRASK